MFELFTEVSRSDSLGDVMEVSVSDLVDFREEIFKPYEGARWEEMMESVGEYGIITPVIVRELGDGYEILSGHNRVRAARALGMESVPVLSRGVIGDDEARFIVTESNILQRGFMEMSLVERAHCIAVRHEAMKKQGIRTDLVEQVEEFDESDDQGSVDNVKELADSFDLSPRTVARYVRIHSLIEPLKTVMDQERFGMVVAVALSNLEEDEQHVVADVINNHEVKVTMQDAEALLDLEDAGAFSYQNVEQLLVKLGEVKAVRIRLSRALISKYFDGYEPEAIHEVLEKALAMWFSRQDGSSKKEI